MHRHYRRHKFSTAVLNFLVAGIFVYAVWTGYKNYAFSGFDDGRINANSVLKEKKFDKMPVEVSTPSGLKVWLIEDHTVPIIALSFIFERAGRAYDPDGQNGRAGIAANMLLYGAGTYNRRQFQDELELNGIQMAFSAGREDFSGMLVTPSENKKTAYALLRTALTEPRFNSQDLSVEQAQNIEALKIQKERPESVLSLAFAGELFGAEHPYGRNPLGDEADIMSLDSEDLKTWLQSSLAKDNLIIGMAGDVTPDEATAAVEEIFSALPAHNANRDIEAPKMNLKPHTRNVERDTAQVVSTFAAAGTSRTATDFYPLYIANHIFGGSGLTSRLSLKAREKEGLTYGVYTYLSTDEKTPLILGQFSSTPENYPAMRKIITDEWRRFADKGATAEELETARSYLLASYNLRFDSVAGLADMLAAMQKYNLGLDFLQKRNDYVNAVTLEEVNAAAARYYSVMPMEVNIGKIDNQE